MSRSGYTDDCEGINLYRGNVERCLKGRKGQAALREMRDALEAMPEKKLVADAFACDDGVCAMGALARHREVEKGVPFDEAQAAVIDLARRKGLDEGDVNSAADCAANALSIPRYLAREVAFENDDHDGFGVGRKDDPEARHARMLKWVNEQIVEKTS